MGKIRVYELAKDLNTNSKRLMEKLAEINIVVKNHMSQLEDNDLQALYSHIGIKNTSAKKEDEDKKAQSVVVTEKKDKSGPRIIRKTEINLDAENRTMSSRSTGFSPNTKVNSAKDIKANKTEVSKSFTETSGLMPGYMRNAAPSKNNSFQGNKKEGEFENQQPRRSNVEDQEVRATKPEVHLDRIESPIENKIQNEKTNEINVDLVQKNQSEVLVEKQKENVSLEKELKSTKSDIIEKHDGEDNKTTVQKNVEIAVSDVEVKAIKAEVNEIKAETQNSETQQPQNVVNQGYNRDNVNRKPSGDYVRNQNSQNNDNRYAGRPGEGNRYQGSSDSANRPQGQSYGNRPQGQRYDSGNRPQGQVQGQGQGQGEGNRPQGQRYDNSNRPQGQGNTEGNRPQGQGYSDPNRPQGQRYDNSNRPQGQGYSDANRPQGQRYDNTNRPQGQRPPDGNRPQGQSYGDGNRPQGQRPPDGNRPQGQSYGNRPQGQPYGNRPQGQSYGDGNRPQGQRPSDGNRPQGGAPRYGDANRPQGGRPGGPGGNSQQNRYGDKGTDNRTGRPQHGGPKGDRIQGIDELLPVSTKPESKRVYSERDFVKESEKEAKKEQRKEVAKPIVEKDRKFKSNSVVLGTKKGVNEVLDENFILQEFYSDDGSGKRGYRPKPRRPQQIVQKAPKPVIITVKLSGVVTVKELAEAMKKTSTDVIKRLMAMGIMATVNQELDIDTATIIADEYKIKIEKEVIATEEDILFDESHELSETLETRPPIVVVMGHVDHGKTSLLDAIRQTNVIDSEAGGITQHIGAYMVKVNNKNITFLDTPGHEAFTAMRARGAQVTDIAILVVAADDGVMPQTIEAINHAKAAKTTIIVAINKMDKPGANPEKVKQELTEFGLVAEEWGGDAICVPVSAKDRTNIDQLLEMVLLSSDMLELKADPNRQAKGTVIEAKLDKDRGPLATVLVQRGTLNIGDAIVTGTTVGRIRAMVDDKGHKVKKAGPSMPVEILGLSEVPEAGELFYVISDEKVAKQLAEKRRNKQREKVIESQTRVTLDDLFVQIKSGKVKDLNLIIKADVQGSVEAIKQSLAKLTNDEVRVNILHGAVGTITESDVTFAQVSNAIIIGFNVRPSVNITEAAKAAGVDVRLYRVIYNAIEDIELAMRGMLDPTYKEVVLGHIQIRQIFKASGIGTIGGGYVIDGKVNRNSEIRVVREGVVVHEGKFGSLKRFKDDAKEVNQGYECGFTVDRFNDIRDADIIECFEMEEVKR